MATKAANEELEQGIHESGGKSKKSNGVRTKRGTDTDKKVAEFINKSPSAIRKMPPRSIQYLIEDLQIQKTDLEIHNRKLHSTQMNLREQAAKYSDLYDNSPAGYFSMDEKGFILEANITGATMLGVERGILKGRPFSGFIAREDQEIFSLHCKELLETKTKQSCALRLVKQNGLRFHAHLECIVLLDEKEKLIQFRAVVSHILEPRPAK